MDRSSQRSEVESVGSTLLTTAMTEPVSSFLAGETLTRRQLSVDGAESFSS